MTHTARRRTTGPDHQFIGTGATTIVGEGVRGGEATTAAHRGASIPEFPASRELCIEQKQDFAELVNGIAPYVECSHASWYAWNTSGATRVARLHGNLVVSWRNVKNGRLCYTFLGLNEPSNTARALLQTAADAGTAPELRLIPEEVAKLLPDADFCIEQDRDHFDYIFDAKELSELRGGKYASKRRGAKRLSRHAETKTALVDPSARAIISSVVNLCERWRQAKMLRGQQTMSPWGKDDVDAIYKMISSAANLKLLVLGIWSGSKDLAALSISEIIASKDSAIIHFMKADTSRYRGSFEAITGETAKMLLGAGCRLINYGEDMGIPSIRTFKLSYRPCGFLRKYIVRAAPSQG